MRIECPIQIVSMCVVEPTAPPKHQVCKSHLTCDKCNQIFRYPSQLLRHMNRKTACDVTRPTSHECKQCSKTFRYPSQLRRHMERKTPCGKVPSGERHPCAACNRTFATRGNVRRHQLHHCPVSKSKPSNQSTQAELHRTIEKQRALIGDLADTILDLKVR